MSFIDQLGLTSQEIKQDIDKGDGVLIDVREQEEVEEGHLAKTYWLALSELSQAPEKFLEVIKKNFNSKNLYLYCRSGGRSGQACEFFKSQGLNAFNIGGFEELSQEFDSKTGELDNRKIS
ncbi:MAG: rhodanese [Halobacteriovoraceae bacterium]|nr:rhodanese [Halobacteriovoraceae bacterium]|tara:strand:+ start:1438 stop:1800 length:363 start_codon:yes stop_codon:yes gene_type:complete